jgi:hypothetical protein
MRLPTLTQTARVRGAFEEWLRMFVSCWFWSRQVLLLFYLLKTSEHGEEVKRLTL